MEAAGLVHTVLTDNATTAPGKPETLTQNTIPLGGKGGSAALPNADIYTPGAGAQAEGTLILIPGAAPAGKDHPELVAFAQLMAKARFRVVIPDLMALRRLAMSSRDVSDIEQVVDAVAAQCTGDAAGSLGLMALSYAAGPTILAAGARPTVRFIVAVGGYYDLEAAIAYLTTGAYETAQGWRKHAPNPYGVWAFARSNARWLRNEEDRRALREIARVKLRNPNADISGLAGGLGPEGRAVLALMTNRDPARVPALISALPAAIRAEINALDLSRHDLTTLKAALLLVHGRDDRMIPYTESMALARAARNAGRRARLVLFDSLMHVEWADTTLLKRVGDGLRLWRTFTALLAHRDHMPPPTDCFGR